MSTQAPRYDIGDVVRLGHVRTKLMDYTGMVGRVTSRRPMWRAQWEQLPDGHIRPVTGPRMSDQKPSVLPMWREGETIVVDYGSYQVLYVPDGWDYTISIPGVPHQVGVRERDIRPLRIAVVR